MGFDFQLQSETLAHINSDKAFPILNTYSLLVVVEYANQALVSKKIDPEMWISLDRDVSVYYAPHIDYQYGNWLKDMQSHSKVINNTVQLKELMLGLV